MILGGPMASARWDEIDNESYDFKESYCAFLDILGYKNQSVRFFEKKFNLYGRFLRALKYSGLANDASKIFVKSDLLKVQFFSDSIVISHPVGDDALFNVLQLCSVFSSHLSYEGLFVRGGLSKGRHFEESDSHFNASFLCSEALQEAYDLESNFAIYPRILIHEKVMRDVDGFSRNFVAKDCGCEFVHFSPFIINAQGGNIGEVQSEMADIYKLYLSHENGRIKDKYEWLLSYYYWTVSLIPGVDLEPFERYRFNGVMNFKK